jgi:hypothetical protein
LQTWAGEPWARLAQEANHLTSRFLGAVHDLLGPPAALARTWPTSTMALWAGALLAIYLFVLYL